VNLFLGYMANSTHNLVRTMLWNGSIRLKVPTGRQQLVEVSFHEFQQNLWKDCSLSKSCR
jgi:hypothetical protein